MQRQAVNNDRQEGNRVIPEFEQPLEELTPEEAERARGGAILLVKYNGRLGEAQDRNGSP